MTKADFITLNLRDAGQVMVWLDVLADLNTGELEEARDMAKLIEKKLLVARGESDAQD